jgi:hypothetical protein
MVRRDHTGVPRLGGHDVNQDRMETWRHPPPATHGPTHPTTRKARVACGLLYALLYPIVNDLIAAATYGGYSRTSQAVRELSATGRRRGRSLRHSCLCSACC